MVSGSLPRFLVTANVVPSSQIVVALMLRGYSETSVPIKGTRRHIPRTVNSAERAFRKTCFNDEIGI
jgi:hypothetical protein